MRISIGPREPPFSSPIHRIPYPARPRFKADPSRPTRSLDLNRLLLIIKTSGIDDFEYSLTKLLAFVQKNLKGGAQPKPSIFCICFRPFFRELFRFFDEAL
jgi:hypothetical protein